MQMQMQMHLIFTGTHRYQCPVRLHLEINKLLLFKFHHPVSTSVVPKSYASQDEMNYLITGTVPTPQSADTSMVEMQLVIME